MAADADAGGRWLSGTEALLAQSWPVHPIIHNANLQCCCFRVKADTDRSAKRMRVQAGNSMNLFVIQVQLLHMLLYGQVGILVGCPCMTLLNLLESKQVIQCQTSYKCSQFCLERCEERALRLPVCTLCENPWPQRCLLLNATVFPARGIE